MFCGKLTADRSQISLLKNHLGSPIPQIWVCKWAPGMASRFVLLKTCIESNLNLLSNVNSWGFSQTTRTYYFSGKFRTQAHVPSLSRMLGPIHLNHSPSKDSMLDLSWLLARPAQCQKTIVRNHHVTQGGLTLNKWPKSYKPQRWLGMSFLWGRWQQAQVWPLPHISDVRSVSPYFSEPPFLTCDVEIACDWGRFNELLHVPKRSGHVVVRSCHDCGYFNDVHQGFYFCEIFLILHLFVGRR